MATSIVRLKRTVNYFNITFSFKSDLEKEEQFLELFKMIVKMSKDKEADRYRQINGSLLFVQDVEFFPQEKQVRGKIRAIRGITPEILDRRNDAVRDVDIEEAYEGVVETTHFVLSHRSAKRRIAIEYHDAGAKATEFEAYLRQIGQRVGLEAIVMKPIFTQDVMSELQRRMGRCKELTIQAHRDGISTIKKIDPAMGAVFEATEEFMSSETITVRFQYDFKILGNSQKATGFIRRLGVALKRNPDDIRAFTQLLVKVEDNERNGRLQEFDLIEDETKSVLSFERKLKSNSLVDLDVYEKITAEMHRLRLT